MPKLNDIRELAEEIAEEVSHSPNAWMNYLDTAARLYRYPFADSLLIHAQRPDATACASMELWNGKMRRWVKRGAKGIALIDDRGRRKRLRYVFDISDTRMVEGGRTPFLWQIREDQRETIRKFLVEVYWLEGEGIESLPGALYALALEVTEEGLDEATAGFAYEDGERFQTMGKEAVREQFKTLLTESIFYVLARRCGLEPEAYIREGAFAGIEDFGSLSRLSFLGDATNKSAESILVWIRREMQKIYREEAETKKENRQDEKKEIEKEAKTAMQEGEKENEIDLSPGRGLPVPGSDHQGGRSRNREIRDVKGNVSEGTSKGMVSESAPFGETEPVSGGSGKSRQGKDGSDDQRSIRKTSGPGQESRLDGMDSLYERDSRNGGGSHFARFGVPLREKADSQEKSDNQEKLDKQEKSVNQKKSGAQRETMKKILLKAEEEKASVLLLSDLPELEDKTVEKIPVQQEVHQLSLFDFMDNNISAMAANSQEMQMTGQEKRENTLDDKLFADNYHNNLASPDLTAGTEKINFRITDNDLGAGGPKQKFRTNLEAIYLLKKLEAENRLALPKEQEILSRYVGWGGIPYAFDERNENWSAEYKELKDILTPEEYQAARASTLNAFYTSPTVIKAMYEILGNMGLRSGNGLEPSCGIGNFMGLLPEGMEGVRMYGVELDGISGRIARQLYQNNSIAIQEFETTDYPDSFFDFVIGNVPFGNYKVSDSKYNRYNFMIHDYFIIKSLDLIRPGGVIAVVTSSGTLDKQNPSVRQCISNRADLLGAIRLPNNAFQRNANTSVVADILFFQKRDRAVINQPDWINLGLTPEGYSINSYFVHHPEMILGELTTEHTQYSRQEVTVKPKEGISLKEQLKEAASHIHGEIEEVELMELADWEAGEKEASILADPSIKNFSFARVDGEVYYRENSRMRRMELPAMSGKSLVLPGNGQKPIQSFLSTSRHWKTYSQRI